MIENESENTKKFMDQVEETIFSKLEQFDEFIDAWQNVIPEMEEMKHNKKSFQTTVLRENEAHKTISEFLIKERPDCKELKLKLEDLERKEVSLDSEIQDTEWKINTLKTKLKEHLTTNEMKIRLFRDSAKMYKQFTGATFNYQGSDISGFITRNSNYQFFNLKVDELSEEQITDHLWNCVAKASDEDWSDIVDEVQS